MGVHKKEADEMTSTRSGCVALAPTVAARTRILQVTGTLW
jgi:hypothetical protein